MITNLINQTTQEVVNPNIVSDNIPASAVTSTKIASSAVTASKIASGAVTDGKLASNSVTASKIALGAVQTNHISPGAIDTLAIEDGAVTSGKIASGAVTYDKIADGAISSQKIADDGIVAGNVMMGIYSFTRIYNQSTTLSYLASSLYDMMWRTNYFRFWYDGGNGYATSIQFEISPSRVYVVINGESLTISTDSDALDFLQTYGDKIQILMLEE